MLSSKRPSNSEKRFISSKDQSRKRHALSMNINDLEVCDCYTSEHYAQ